MENKKGISGSTLKIIAIVTMVIDHIGAAVLARLLMVNGLGELDQTNADAIMQWLSANGALYWTYTIMRMIGRVAFPIFCFLLVEGFLHTHDVKKYAMRLGLFALLSEIPFDLAFSSKILEFNYQNVFFTLFIGLLTMIAYRAVEEKEEWNQALKVILYILIVAAGMALAYFLKTDYAEKGVFCIMVLYIFHKKKMWQIIAGCASFIWETPALFGFIPIAFYNGTRGWKMKYFFYIFYPAHLLILYLLCYFMGISGYSGIISKPVELTRDNIDAVLDYGQRFFILARITDKAGDVMIDDEPAMPLYIPDHDSYILMSDKEAIIRERISKGEKMTAWLVGSACQVVYIENPNDANSKIKLIGVDPLNDKKCITISDMIALYSYMLSMLDGVGSTDEIDMLGNRRIRTVGELIQNQFRIGLSRMEKAVKEKMSIADVETSTPKSLTNNRPLSGAIKEFFSSSQLSQFMDQQNPLAELTNKRRISALGPGGLTRERAGFEVRDVHNSHYGRICPIETPEGQNIGLISYLTSYAKVNEYGFIQTPYRKVDKNGHVSEDYIYLSADDENDYIIAQANEVEDGKLKNEMVVARKAGETIMAKAEEVELCDVSPKQIVSIAAACIPFLENDDCTRALMGANMQRQAVPLLNPHSPYVGTGIEAKIARDSGTGVVTNDSGVVTYADSRTVVIADKDGNEHEYPLEKFARSNAGTCINQKPIVAKGDMVKAGELIADGPSMQDGELALGQNVTIAFMTWHGYNYEDAIIMSERMVKDDVYTSIHIEEYTIERRKTKLGEEEITRDIPNVQEGACRNLDSRGIVMVGAEVKEGDILVGKVTPKGQSDASPEEKLLLAIFGEKSHEVRDNSLRVPHGGAGIVQSIRVFNRKDGHDELNPGVIEEIRVYVVQKRKISEGDKMAGRHGNKGVISKILPIEDMPIMPDGTPVDIMLNPFGVPSRMNIGQVLEVHLGMAAKKLGVKFATPVFDGISNEDLMDIMKEAEVNPDGKLVLRDGKTGEPYDERISVGVMYMIKLAHMVDDKLHARATGPYSMVTQQPLGGKAQNGGQRFGEMEVWALEAYGAAHTLEEILTIKSDDINGRTRALNAIKKSQTIPEPGLPESFNVLRNELKALAVDVKLLDGEGNEVNVSSFADDDETQDKNNQVAEASDLTIKTEAELEEEAPEAVMGLDEE